MIASTCPVSYGQLKPIPKTIVDTARGVPRATDLRSALAALRALLQLLNHMLHQPPHVNNTVVPREPSVILKGDDQVSRLKGAEWVEDSRVYGHDVIVNPDDPTQYIQFRPLNAVTFHNMDTSITLVYTRFL